VRLLEQGRKGKRLVHLVRFRQIRIGDHANDLEVMIAQVVEPQAASDRVGATEHSPCQSCGDDGDFSMGCVIGPAEVASGQDGDAERFEVARRHRHDERLGSNSTVCRDRSSAWIADFGDGLAVGQGGCRNAGNRSQCRRYLPEGRHHVAGPVDSGSTTERGRHEPFGLESRIDARQPMQVPA